MKRAQRQHVAAAQAAADEDVANRLTAARAATSAADAKAGQFLTGTGVLLAGAGVIGKAVEPNVVAVALGTPSGLSVAIISWQILERA